MTEADDLERRAGRNDTEAMLELARSAAETGDVDAARER